MEEGKDDIQLDINSCIWHDFIPACYICETCDGYFCTECGKQHKLENPLHEIVNFVKATEEYVKEQEIRIKEEDISTQIISDEGRMLQYIFKEVQKVFVDIENEMIQLLNDTKNKYLKEKIKINNERSDLIHDIWKKMKLLSIQGKHFQAFEFFMNNIKKFQFPKSKPFSSTLCFPVTPLKIIKEKLALCLDSSSSYTGMLQKREEHKENYHKTQLFVIHEGAEPEILRKFDTHDFSECKVIHIESWATLGDNVGTRAAKTLFKFDKIHGIYLSGMELSNITVEAFAKCIKEKDQLLWLGLQGNLISSHSLRTLKLSVETSPNLQRLFLGGHMIGDKGSLEIAGLIKASRFLIAFYLSSFNLNGEGFGNILKVVKCHPTLQRVYLGGNFNEIIVKEAVYSLREQSGIEHLSICSRSISDTFCQKLTLKHKKFFHSLLLEYDDQGKGMLKDFYDTELQYLLYTNI